MAGERLAVVLGDQGRGASQTRPASGAIVMPIATRRGRRIPGTRLRVVWVLTRPYHRRFQETSVANQTRVRRLRDASSEWRAIRRRNPERASGALMMRAAHQSARSGTGATLASWVQML